MSWEQAVPWALAAFFWVMCLAQQWLVRRVISLARETLVALTQANDELRNKEKNTWTTTTR